MKKIPILIGEQKNKEFGLAILNPKDVIKTVRVPEANTAQDTQRPWKVKKVEEIAKYIAGKLSISDGRKNRYAKGILPNCPILNVMDPIKIVKEDGVNYLLFPDNSEEFKNCFGKVEILDGQHRLISFKEEYLDPDFKTSEQFTMGFTIFQNLTRDEKLELFMMTNDRQEKVESNLLRQFKKWLGLLSNEESQIFELVEALNSESVSPLKGRIIVGGNKVKYGIKLTQLSKILKKSGVHGLINNRPKSDQVHIISEYLKAWSAVYEGEFNNPRHTLGKVSGFRYIFYIFPAVYDILVEKQKPFNIDNIKDILIFLRDNLDGKKIFTDDELKMAFRGETSTIQLAKNHADKLKNEQLNSSGFDPFSVIGR